MALQVQSNAATGKSALSGGFATVTRVLHKTFRVQEVLIVVVGLICYVLVSHMFITLPQNNNALLAGPIFPALLLPLLFGVLFGRLIGFLVGIFGYIASYTLHSYAEGVSTCGTFRISSFVLHYCNYVHTLSGKKLSLFLDYIFNYHYGITLPPLGWAIGIGLIAVIAGFVRQPLQGFLSGIGLLFASGVIGAASLLVGTLIAAFAQDIFLQVSHQATATTIFASFDMPPTQLVLGFLLAPIAVIIYNIGQGMSKKG